MIRINIAGSTGLCWQKCQNRIRQDLLQGQGRVTCNSGVPAILMRMRMRLRVRLQNGQGCPFQYRFSALRRLLQNSPVGLGHKAQGI